MNTSHVSLLLLDWAAKGTLVLALVWVANFWFLSRQSSALRHAIWLAGLAAVVALPVLGAILPGISAGLPKTELVPAAVSPTSTGIPNSVVIPGFAPEFSGSAVIPSISWAVVFAVICLVGTVFLLIRLGIAHLRLWRQVRASVRVTEPRFSEELEVARRRFGIENPVCLRMGNNVRVPMVCGWAHPTILLPQSAETWSAKRLRAVFLHELSHVSRRDVPIQFFVELTRCFAWFQPLVWIAVRELKREREQACDDRVLAAGQSAPDYAKELLEVVTELRELTQMPVPAMARGGKRGLDSRIRSILDQKVSRRAMGGWGTAMTFVVMLSVCLPLATVDLLAEDAEPELESLSGRLLVDGAMAGGREVLLRSIVGDKLTVWRAETDPTGKFRFEKVPKDVPVRIAVAVKEDDKLGWSTRTFYFATGEGILWIQDEHKQRTTTVKSLQIEVQGAGRPDFLDVASNQSMVMQGGGSITISGGSIVAGGGADNGGARISGQGSMHAKTLRWVLR